ncbi:MULTISPECIES: type II toxin-antitoxin system RelE/ParE family toxin [Flavobacterium]|uniref:Type II toxin-antitoxin system RelE/ParE family toxin n=1 Tax=Flavobacterium covae TaxID=2906076 RepID=A0ABW8PE00_9FLAO|nr:MULTISPECIES: type II toxin-antitoxin system RelE/ParE family toxin [Flavobacterium]
MYNYDLSEQAKIDLLRIYEYRIGQFGLDQADKYFDMMHDCFNKIAKIHIYSLWHQILSQIITNVFAELTPSIIKLLQMELSLQQ